MRGAVLWLRRESPYTHATPCFSHRVHVGFVRLQRTLDSLHPSQEDRSLTTFPLANALACFAVLVDGIELDGLAEFTGFDEAGELAPGHARADMIDSQTFMWTRNPGIKRRIQTKLTCNFSAEI
jgi:hypothetical protein